jgi:hypothetical protein
LNGRTRISHAVLAGSAELPWLTDVLQASPVATAKQIAANRANARLSTGPKTDSGRFNSSRNAFRHGLSGPLPMEGAIVARIDIMARALGSERLCGGEAGS